MPYVEVRGKYRTFRYDGTTPLDFTTYNNLLCVVRRPNPTTFITLQQYVPGQGGPFTTFQPGSSYTIVTKADGTQGSFNFDIGPYTRVDRLPSSTFIKSPNFYIGLDKNSIVIPLSNYALSVNSPLSSIVNIVYINGQGNRLQYVYADNFKTGAPLNFTHLYPNSGYELRNRVPFTFFAPLQSEMGDAYAWGGNNGAYGMGYFLGSNLYLSAHNLYGLWDKISVGGSNYIDTSGNISSNHVLALSSCGGIKKLFVTGANNYGQLGTGDINSRSVWTAISGEWSDIAAGYSSSYALSTNGKLFATGWNNYGQLGITSDTSVISATMFTQEALKGTWSKISSTGSSLLALSSNGKLFGCGYNLYGQLGLKNYTPSIYTLSQEASGGIFTKIFSNGNYSFAISGGAGGRVLGTGYNNNGQLGIGSPANSSYKMNTFVPELCGFTNVTDVYFGANNTAFIKTNESTLRGAGFNTSNRYLFLSNGGTVAEQSPQTFQPTYVPNDIKAFLWIGGGVRRIYTVALNNTLKENIYNDQGYFNTPYNYFNLFSGNGNSVVFALSARNDLRPTPTPTVTPSSTPSVLYPPVNVSEVGIFGGTLVYTTRDSCRNVRVYNTPGNLSNNFTYEVTNNYLIPPGNASTTTFDYEKSSSFNNIVGISLNNYYPQTPNGRNHVKYLWKKVGSNWTYTLLPSNLDGGYSYRTFESGGESLFISEPHPSYGSFFSQGIYSYVFADIPSSGRSNNNRIMLAMSYDRGSTWELSTLLYNINSSMYDGYGATSKVIFSRSRESDYKVRLVGNTGLGSPYGRRYSTINGDTLYYYETFRNISNDEVVDYASPLSIKGHDFKHDYFNIPTVASTAVTSYPSNRGQIRLSRRINNVWQTNVVIDNITDPCFGPYYQVPWSSISFYSRAGAPIISMEFDPKNPDLVYIAYLRGITQYTSPTDPGKINVCCYNMRTNALVFDESVVFAKNEPGSPILRSTGVFVDIPTLYFDTTDNTLNLFFFGVDYVPVLAGVTYKYYKTKRLGTNSWTAITNLFADTYPGAPGYDGTYMTNCWELKTKY